MNEKRMTVYYAHPMSWYGTKEERKDIAHIKRKWPDAEVINPADLSARFEEWRVNHRNAGDPEPYMDFFLAEVENADVVVYRRFNDGTLGAGVATEVFHAFLRGKSVHQALESGVTRTPLLMQEQALHSVLTIAETKAKVKKGEL